MPGSPEQVVLAKAQQNPWENDNHLTSTYEFLGRIGTGGMGAIYKARHKFLDKFVAIKFIHPQLVSEKSVRRFRVEGKAGAMLSDPSFVRVHTFDVTASGAPYIVMDYVEGETLSDELSKGKPLELNRFLDIFRQVGNALSHAHSKSVIHRDIKPSNIMLFREHGVERICILDFGIAKLIDDTEPGAEGLTRTGDAVGSPKYMSPEQAKGPHIDVRSDIYSLGCTMYECLTGTAPFVGSTPYSTMIMHTLDAPPPMVEASLGREIPEPIEKVVRKCLEKKPDDRYQNVADLVNDLELFRKHGTLSPVAFKPVATQGLSKKQIVGVGIAVTVLIGVALSTIAFIDHGSPLNNGTRSHSIDNSANVATATSTKPADENGTTATSISDTKTSPNASLESNNELPTESIGDIIEAPIRNIIQSQRKTKRRYVDLEFFGRTTPTNDETAEQLSEFTPDVDTLDLSAWKISDHGLAPIQHLQLKRLKLSYTGVENLEPLRKFPKLFHLDVDHTNLSKSAMQVLSELPSLEEIKLESTPITDEDLNVLAKAKHLRYLNVRNCQNLTTKGLKQFLQQRPNCRLIFSPVGPDVWADVALIYPGFGESENLLARRRYSDAKIKLASLLPSIPASHTKERSVILSHLADACFNLKDYKNADDFQAKAIALWPHKTDYHCLIELMTSRARTLQQLNENAEAKTIRLEIDDLSRKVAADTIAEKRRAAEIRAENFDALVAICTTLKQYGVAAQYAELASENLEVVSDNRTPADRKRIVQYQIKEALLCCLEAEQSANANLLIDRASKELTKAKTAFPDFGTFERAVIHCNSDQPLPPKMALAMERTRSK